MITIGNEKVLWKEGLTIAQVLTALDHDYEYAVVRINGKLISKPNFKNTPVTDNSEIIPIPMIAGG
ncbi:MoaD/ThiS family protein [Desulfococcaceae bacterium HSG9]|nr:MoaD/ThiS family protein [Desulfococcaceae bacterium HSG9]